jgi:hypothetical protein
MECIAKRTETAISLWHDHDGLKGRKTRREAGNHRVDCCLSSDALHDSTLLAPFSLLRWASWAA